MAHVQNYTEVMVERLPPGNYEIYQTEVKFNDGVVTYSSRTTGGAIPFQIVAGRATYIGALTVVPRLANNVFGRPTFHFWGLVWGNAADRDLAIALRRHPELKEIDGLAGSQLTLEQASDEPAINSLLRAEMPPPAGTP